MNPTARKRKKAVCPPIGALMRYRDRIVRAYSEEFYRVYEYSWQMGAAAFETGATLLHVVFEKKPFGSNYRESIVTW